MGIKSVPTQNSIQKQVDSTFAAGATSIVLNEDVSSILTGVSATNPGVFVVDRVDSNGNATPTKREYCTFTGVSSATLTGVTKNADSSGSDQEHAVGAIVEFVPDVLHAQSIKDTFETEHNADGTHGDVDLANSTDFTAEHTAAGAHTAASTTEKGQIEIATAAETTTGTDATRAVSPDGLAGSDYGKRIVELILLDDGTDTATGDGAGDITFTVPSEINGWNLVNAHAAVEVAGATGTTDIQIYNVTQTADMLTTKITIDSGELTSYTAATPPVIDTSNDDVATGDALRFDVDAVSTTAAKGLKVIMTFQLP